MLAMKVAGTHYRSIWPIERPGQGNVEHAVGIIDQTQLPYAFACVELANLAAVADAIRTMRVRGAPLIGVAAAYGVALALRADRSDASLAAACEALAATRPTAVNLRSALERMRGALLRVAAAARADEAWREAGRMADEDVQINRALGAQGARLIAQAYQHNCERNSHRNGHSRTVNVLTHCNAGWIAAVDYGTALSAIYQAYDAGVPVHVWVDETRPRNQGLLTAWELAAHGVPHTLIVDNASGLLLQRGQVDLVLVGADRATRGGDICNKIGTYLTALAANDNGVPFYACVPSPTIDWRLDLARDEVVIEERDHDEVRTIAAQGGRARLAGSETPVANPAFDITPARLVTGVVTERGIAAPAQLAELFPEQRQAA